MSSHNHNTMMISVIGGSSPTQEAVHRAEEVGRELARRGVTVVCGGLEGVMAAVCRGANEEGWATVGILPGDDPSVGNTWVDYPGCTGLGCARCAVVAKSGRAVIAIDGAYGTLSEIGHALSDGVPVIGLGTWGLSRNGSADTAIVQAATAVEAVDKAMEAAKARKLGESAS